MTIAAIDIGSNSVRLLVLDDTGNQLVRETTVTALGRGVDATGRFRDDTVAATLDVMHRYAASINEYGATRVRAVATSASRDAENGDALMVAIGGILAHTQRSLQERPRPNSHLRMQPPTSTVILRIW